jgi:hypothetical protein
MSFVMAQVVGRRYSAVFGFENEADASKAASLIKRVRGASEESWINCCGRRKSCGA